MNERLKEFVLIVTIIVSTIACVTEVGAMEATYQSIGQIRNLPVNENLYGEGKEVPIAFINEMDAELEMEAQKGISFSKKYDPREEMAVTEIKDQGSWGLCWDYATIATAESCLIRQGYADHTINLSELHLAYFSYKDSGSTMSFTGYCNGGLGEAGIYFQRRIGPVAESKVPMREITNDLKLDEKLHYDHINPALVKRVKGSYRQPETIKEMIVTYGGVYSSFYWYQNAAYFKEAGDDTTYHFPYKVQSANHAVEIVGWDDTYSGKNFSHETEDGAWLVKNSWGAHGYDTAKGSGFYWVPYSEYSLSISNGFSYQFDDSSKAVSGIELSDHQITMYVGQSRKITAKVYPESAIDKSVTYLTQNENNAGGISVDQDGTVTAVRAGKSKLKVTSSIFPDITDVCYVTALEDEITIDAPRVMYGIKTRDVIRASNHTKSPISFCSSNEKVVNVDEEGNLITCGYGECDITVTSKGAANRNVRIKVIPASLAASEEKITGKVGDEINISLFLDGVKLDRTNRELSQNLAEISYISTLYDECADMLCNIAEDICIVRLNKAGKTTLHIQYDGYGATLFADIEVYVEEKAAEKALPVMEDTGFREPEQIKESQVKEEPGQTSEKNYGFSEEDGLILYRNLCYERISDTQVRFAGPNKEKKKVVIPPKIVYKQKTYIVTQIADRAFYKSRKLKYVVLPESIKEIGKESFYGCKNLRNIKVKSAKLKKVGKRAFGKISKKAVMKVPPGKTRKYKKLLGYKKLKVI